MQSLSWGKCHIILPWGCVFIILTRIAQYFNQCGTEQMCTFIPIRLESSGRCSTWSCWSFPEGISQLVRLLDTGTRLKVDFSLVHRTSTRSLRFCWCKARASFKKVAPFPSLLLQVSSKATLHISWLLFSRFMSRSWSKENSRQRPIISQYVPSPTAISSLIPRGHSVSRSVTLNPWRDKISSKLGPGSLTILVMAIYLWGNPSLVNQTAPSAALASPARVLVMQYIQRCGGSGLLHETRGNPFSHAPKCVPNPAPLLKFIKFLALYNIVSP